MSVDADVLREIDAFLVEASCSHATVTALRVFAPRLMVTRCDALDMRDETPFRRYAQCDLFLIDGRGHCWKITAEPSEATGLVVAPKGATA